MQKRKSHNLGSAALHQAVEHPAALHSAVEHPSSPVYGLLHVVQVNRSVLPAATGTATVGVGPVVVDAGQSDRELQDSWP